MAADRQSGTAIVQPPGAYRSEPFTLGPMKSTLLIVEGDGELPIAREDVRLVISKQMVDVPDEAGLRRVPDFWGFVRLVRLRAGFAQL